MGRLRKVIVGIIIVLLMTNWIVKDVNKKAEEKRLERELIALEKVVVNLAEREEVKKEKLRDHYDVELFFKDYSKEKEELTKLYADELNKGFSQFSESLNELYEGFFLQAKIEFYNQTLESYSNGAISFEDIYNDKGNSIKEITIEFYFFKTDRYATNDYKPYIEELIASYYLEHDIELELISRMIWANALKKKGIEDYASMEYPFVELVSRENVFNVDYFTILGEEMGTSNIFGNDIHNEIFDELEERHNEKFTILYEKPGSNSVTYAPLRNLDERFEVDYGRDRFTAIHVQQYVTNRVKEILEKYSLEEKCLVFSTPSYSKNKDEALYTMKFDYLKETDDIGLVNERIESDVETSVYLMYETKDEINYDDVKSVIEEYKALYPEKLDTHHTIAVYFVQLSEDDQKIAYELFKDKDHTEGSFGTYGLFDVSQLFISETDHEGFRFIKYFGNIDKECLYINKSIKNLSTDEMLENMTREK